MRISEKARELFGENIKFLDGISSKRLHPYVDEGTAEKIRTESSLLGITLSEYVLYTAFSFKTDDIPQKLDCTLEKINQYMETNNIQCNISKNEGDGNGMKDKGEKGEQIEITAKKERNEQFHLRITPESYDEIKRRAAELSMSLSDYVVFVTTHFDIMDISRKIDEINRKLDAINSAK